MTAPAPHRGAARLCPHGTGVMKPAPASWHGCEHHNAGAAAELRRAHPLRATWMPTNHRR
jgi:hypothetical protein